MSTQVIKLEKGGKEFLFYPTPQAEQLIREIFSDNYKVLGSGITFESGDVILDIGACEGMFSIMMAKLFPEVRVIALEPISRTYFMMMRNIGLNGITNIEPFNIGVAGKADTILMNMCKEDHSGGGSAVMTFNPEWHEQVYVKVNTLDQIFEDCKIDKCRLIKIDIEGMEYESLYKAEKSLKKTDYLVGEFHMNARLDYKGYRMDGLASWVSNRTKLLFVEPCRMAE